MVLLSLWLTLLAFTTAIQVAKPGGRYGIGFRQHILPKLTTKEPTAAPNGTGTFILMSIYYPTTDKSSEPGPYFDKKSSKIWGEALTYPNGSLETLETELQPDAAFLSSSLSLPTLILSPGGGVNSFMYYGLISSLVSHGYIVLALDHPYEPPALLLPNGTTIIGSSIYTSYNSSTSSEIERSRISDMEAAVAAWPEYAGNLSAPFNTSAFITLGHSVGGAAAAVAAADIEGVLAGLNLDGAFWEPFFPEVGKPFLTMTSINHTAQFDPSLTKFAERQSAWNRVLSVYGSAHLDYSDVDLWPQLLGLGEKGVLSTPQIGPIGGLRMLEVVRAYVAQFLDFVCDGVGGILERPSLEWWEVIYINGTVGQR